MYPSAFEYSAPHSLDEALAMLGELGEDGRVLAGGQSLLPMMKIRLANPAADRHQPLTRTRHIERANGHLAVGALARHAEIAASDLVTAGNRPWPPRRRGSPTHWCATGARWPVRSPTVIPRATGTPSARGRRLRRGSLAPAASG